MVTVQKERRVIKAPENYEWVRTKFTHIQEYECQNCHSRSSEAIKCCNEKMIKTTKHAKWKHCSCC